MYDTADRQKNEDGTENNVVFSHLERFCGGSRT